MKVGNDEIEFEVTTADGAGGLVAAAVRMPPGGGPPALHRHGPSELYRVERGEFAFYVEAADGAIRALHRRRRRDRRDRRRTRAHDPQRVRGRRGGVRRLRAGGRDGDVRPRRAARRDADAPVPMERVMAVAAEHGIEITRPLVEVA